MVFIITTDMFVQERFTKVFGDGVVRCFKSYADMISECVPNNEDVVAADILKTEPFDLTKLKCSVLALVGTPKYEEAVQLMRFGVRGYGNRLMMPANFVMAVNALSSGQVWMPPDIINRLINAIPENVNSNGAGDMSMLSEREMEVARYVAQGQSNIEIADNMDITVRTVKAHLTSIFNKTGLRDRVALALRLK
ncbi:LuxR C-terminal-related transcriptional regulator [Deferribacteres bacterium DY0037]